MNYPNFKVIGIGHFATNCIKKLESQNIPEVKTMKVNHISERDLSEVCDFLSGDPAITIIIADLGNQFCDFLALSVVNLSKEAGEVTLCILTTPFIFEGEKALHNALVTASNIQHISDACLILTKEIPEDSNFTFMQGFNRIGTYIYASTIADMVRNLVEMTTPSASINIDAEDIKQSLRDKGTFVITRGKGGGENRVSKALEATLSSPLMWKCDIYSSRNILFKLLVPEHTDVSSEDFSPLSQFLERMPSHVDVKWGITKSDALQGEVELILLASGFNVKLPEK